MSMIISGLDFRFRTAISVNLVMRLAATLCRYPSIRNRRPFLTQRDDVAYILVTASLKATPFLSFHARYAFDARCYSDTNAYIICFSISFLNRSMCCHIREVSLHMSLTSWTKIVVQAIY